MALNFSSIASEKTLQADINGSVTAATLDDTVGFPAPPFTVAIDYGLINEEIVLVGATSGANITSLTRGYAGSTAVTHSTGAKVRHVVEGSFLSDLADHLDDTTAVHGVSSDLVGTTDVQDLDRKTFVSADSTGAPITVKAASGQSDNILVFQDSAGTPTAGVTPAGRLQTPGVDGSNTSTFTAGAAGTVPLITKGAASQTAKLLSARNSSNTELASISPAGRIAAAAAFDGTGETLLTPASTSTKALTIQGLASQSSAVMEYLANGGTVLIQMKADGSLQAVALQGGSAILTSPAAGTVPLTTINNGGQTADAWQHKSSGGSVLAKLDKLGNLTVVSVTETDYPLWQTYSPTVTGASSGGSVGNGTMSATYKRWQDTIFVMIDFELGSTSSLGTGGVRFSLPVTAKTLSRAHVGSGFAVDTSGSAYRVLAAELDDTTHALMVGDDGIVTAFTPWTWATGDKIRANLTYQASS